MSESWNNVKTVCCKPWLVLPTVYSDALSYSEQLDKFCYSLNKLIENNNILPDFIADKIKEYISSGAIGEVVQEILANYILNVKYPPKGVTPAVGDGSADDTEAIQGCIDYATKNGGVVYFPYGSYLTQPLTMKNGVSLFGFDRYSTKVVLKGGATKALLNGNGNNLSVCNLTLDGNNGIQVNDVNVVDMTGSNLMFNDLVIKDGYKLFNFVGDGHLQLSNIVFGNAVENCFSVDGNVIVQTNNLLFTALSKVGGVSVVDIRANGGNYEFNSVAKCDTCMLISGNDNKVNALIGGASEDYVDTGEHNNVEIVGHSQKKYYSGNVKKDANNSETTLQGTRSLHVVGASTFAVDGNSTESVDGNKSEIVTGVTTETYKNTKTVNLTTEEKNAVNKTDTIMNKYSLTTKEFILNIDTATANLKEHLFNLIFDDKKINLYYTLYDFVNVKDYGAVGDGITDDTQAFKNAASHGNVFVPNGKYIVTELTGAITVLCSGEIISDLTLTNFEGVLIGGKYKYLNLVNCNCRLTNIKATNTSGTLMATNSKLVIENSYFKGGSNCVLLESCYNSTIDNIFVEAIKSNTEDVKLHCVQLNKCTHCKITNSFALNGNWFGFSIYNSFKCTITDCISLNSYAEGINFENTNSSIMSNNIVSWDDDVSNDYGLSLFGNNDKSANLNIISNNLVYNCKQSGIAIDGNAHTNHVYGNNLINCNAKNSIRNAAITSSKLDGYTGQPGNNYIHDNLLIPSNYTTGLYEEINALSENFINNNFSSIPLNIGHYGMSIIGSNVGIDTIQFNSTSNNGEVSASFITGITPTFFMISATINIEEIKATQISIPYNTNSLVFGCAFNDTNIQATPVFGNNKILSFTPSKTGIHYVRAVVSLYNR